MGIVLETRAENFVNCVANSFKVIIIVFMWKTNVMKNNDLRKRLVGSGGPNFHKSLPDGSGLPGSRPPPGAGHVHPESHTRTPRNNWHVALDPLVCPALGLLPKCNFVTLHVSHLQNSNNKERGQTLQILVFPQGTISIHFQLTQHWCGRAICQMLKVFPLSVPKCEPSLESSGCVLCPRAWYACPSTQDGAAAHTAS